MKTPYNHFLLYPTLQAQSKMLSIESIRVQCEAEILQQNAQYNLAMKTLFDKYTTDDIVTKLYDHLQKRIKQDPSAQSFEARFRIPMGELFTDTLTRDSTTPPPQPLCVYFKNTDNRIRAVKLTYNIEHSLRTEFQEYLYTADPTVQAFRAFLHSKFPGAALQPFLYTHTSTPFNLELDIAVIYKVPLSPDFPLVKAQKPYRKYEGDWVYWHEEELKK